MKTFSNILPFIFIFYIGCVAGLGVGGWILISLRKQSKNKNNELLKSSLLSAFRNEEVVFSNLTILENGILSPLDDYINQQIQKYFSEFAEQIKIQEAPGSEIISETFSNAQRATQRNLKPVRFDTEGLKEKQRPGHSPKSYFESLESPLQFLSYDPIDGFQPSTEGRFVRVPMGKDGAGNYLVVPKDGWLNTRQNYNTYYAGVYYCDDPQNGLIRILHPAIAEANGKLAKRGTMVICQ